MTLIACLWFVAFVWYVINRTSEAANNGGFLPKSPDPHRQDDTVRRYLDATSPLRRVIYMPTPVTIKQVVAKSPSPTEARSKKLPPVDPTWTVQPIFFKPGEPTTFDEFNGQAAVVNELRDALAALAPEQRALPPQMFLGPAGMGKTLLAKILANELQARAEAQNQSRVYFFERLSYDIDTAEKLDEVMKQAEAHPGCVLFIDEIHGLPRPVATKLYSVLEEHRYAYQNELIRKLVPFTLVGATTDYGSLEAPMQRRWVRHQLERSTPDQLLETVLRRSKAGLPIDEAAAKLLVDRVKLGGAPWEAVRVYNLAATAAKAAQEPKITQETAEMVLDRYGIDDYGLDRYDRECIKAIFTQPLVKKTGTTTEVAGYRCSEDAVAAIAGVDKAYYRDTIRPKLMSRGLLIIRAGQMLTPKAVETYGYLRGA